MTHILETAFEIINNENPNGSPSIKGYNVINGQLRESSSSETFKSINPAILDDCHGHFPFSTKQDVE